MIQLMNVLKRVFVISTMILISVSLGACGVVAPMPTATAPIVASLMPSAIPPTSTETPPPLSTSTPVSIPISSPPDGLRMAYVIDGNLYVQDSSKRPVQLTDSGLDRSPIFSDDGERVVFYRGEAFYIYSIHTDGSQEQVLVTPDLMTKLNLGYSELTKIGNIAFIPGTHQLLFNTIEVKPWSDNAPHISSMDVQPNQDVLLMDIDSKEVKRLLAPGEGAYPI